MTGLLFVIAAAVGMLIPVVVYSFWGPSLIMTGGLIVVIALLTGLCLSIERDRRTALGQGEDKS